MKVLPHQDSLDLKNIKQCQCSWGRVCSDSLSAVSIWLGKWRSETGCGPGRASPFPMVNENGRLFRGVGTEWEAAEESGPWDQTRPASRLSSATSQLYDLEQI